MHRLMCQPGAIDNEKDSENLGSFHRRNVGESRSKIHHEIWTVELPIENQYGIVEAKFFHDFNKLSAEPFSE